MSLADELREAVAIVLMVEPESIPLKASLTELGVDSITRLELISLVEKNLGKVVPDDQIGHLDSIEQIVGFAHDLAAA